jgi:hypothetical protein
MFIYFAEDKNKLNSFSPFILISFLASLPVVQALEKTEASLTKLFLTFFEDRGGLVWKRLYFCCLF